MSLVRCPFGKNRWWVTWGYPVYWMVVHLRVSGLLTNQLTVKGHLWMIVTMPCDWSWTMAGASLSCTWSPWSKGAAPCDVLHIRVITWCVTCHLQSVLSLAMCSLCCHLSVAVLLNSVFNYERYKPNIKRTDVTQCDWTQHDRAAKRLWWKIQDKTGDKETSV